MKKTYWFAAAFGAFLCIAPTSCSNENEMLEENPTSEEIVFDKDEVVSDEEIIFSTFDKSKKNGLKAGGAQTYDIRVLHSSSNDLPDSKYMDGGWYYKLNLDLNEGAGGEWIYLYYRFAYSVEESITNLVGIASRNPSTQSSLRSYINRTNFTPFAVAKDYGFATDENSNLVNLNAGSGGKCVYLGMTKNSYFAPITGIQVVSTTKDYINQNSKVEDGRTYYPVKCWCSILDNANRDVVGRTLDYNMDTKKHKKNIYIYYTRD
ncbi:MAG: hypothetical protein K6G31_09390 [Paludibacteraceae bacterium]|nr:hypothetical protein [Paludibacteraceae bacterium]